MTKARLILKIFLVTAIPSGLLMGFLSATLGALSAALPGSSPVARAVAAVGPVVIGLVSGSALGATMAAILGALHFSQTSDPRVHHTRKLVLDTSLEAARAMCVEALRAIPGVSVDDNISSSSRIEARKGLTWRSWGDSITCRMDSITASQQSITISSRPTLQTTMVDYGSNLENVETVVSHLRRSGARVVLEA